jgi:D-threo-aldose 1-dehydrogenase
MLQRQASVIGLRGVGGRHPGLGHRAAYAALDQLRCEGTIRAVGVGMNQAPLLEWFVERADLDCVLVGGRYSLLNTAAADSLFPA